MWLLRDWLKNDRVVLARDSMANKKLLKMHHTNVVGNTTQRYKENIKSSLIPILFIANGTWNLGICAKLSNLPSSEILVISTHRATKTSTNSSDILGR